MDVALSAEQDELIRTVRRVIEKRRIDHGPLPVRTFDPQSLDALLDNGLLDVIAGGGSPLDAELLVEETGRYGVGAPVAARAFVAPLLLAGTGLEPGRCIALVDRPQGGLVRFGLEADQLLVLDGDVAVVAGSSDVKREEVHTRWGFPVARVHVHGGRRLGAGSGAQLRRLWKIGLAAEGSGLMSASVARAAEYVTGRHQFGKAIGSYQAVQHRLARAKVMAEGTAWLARRAAWTPDDELAVGMAAIFGAEGMRDSVKDVQQVCGAIGITDEFELTRTSMKMAYLATELGGPTAHARAYARERYLTGRSRRPAPGYMGKGVRPSLMG